MNGESREFKYDGFISYSWKDKFIAEQISIFLRRYRPPKNLSLSKKKIEIFRDTERLSSSFSLTAELQNKLKNSDYLILLCSKSSSESKFVDFEVEYFLNKKGLNFITFIGLEQNFTDNLTPSLKKLNVSPLFIELTDKKSFKKECLRIVAKIYNVDYNKLLLEDEKRLKYQRLFWLGFLIIFSISILSIFSISKIPSDYWKEVELPILSWPNRVMPFKPLTEIAFNKNKPDDILFLYHNAEFFESKNVHGLSENNVDEEEYYIVPFDNNYNRLISEKNLFQNKNNIVFWNEIKSHSDWITFKKPNYKEILSLGLMNNFDTCTHLMDQISTAVQPISNSKSLEDKLCTTWDEYYLNDYIEVLYSEIFIGKETFEIIELIGSNDNPHDSPTESTWIYFYRYKESSSTWSVLNINKKINSIYPLDNKFKKLLILSPEFGVEISADSGKSWKAAAFNDKRLDNISNLRVYVISNDIYILIMDKSSVKLNNNVLVKLSKNTTKDRWIKGLKQVF